MSNARVALQWRLGACLWLALVQPAALAGLEYKLEGLSREQRDNARAWLGEAPEDERGRGIFLATARERLSSSLQALGYYRADLDFNLDKSREPWRLVVEVDPGEPVRIETFSVEVEGEARDDPEFVRLLQNLPLAAGSVLHHGKYEDLKKSLLTLGQRRGYLDAEITRSRVEVQPATNSARVDVVYRSGERYRFGELRHDGESLYTGQLQALQPFTTGDPYSLAQLQEFQSQLQRTGYFSGVLVQPRVDEARDGQVPLELELFPAKRHTFEVGVGYSTDTEERVSLIWRTPRVNRYGHSQETRLEYSAINPSGSITYNIPLTHPLNDVLQLRARLEQNEFGDLDSDQRELGVRRELRQEPWVYGVSLRSLEERWKPRVEVLPLRSSDAAGNRRADLLLPGFTIARKSRRGSLVNPSQGLSQFYQLEGGSDQAGSDLNLLRGYARLVGVASLAEKHRLVGRFEAGAVFVSEGQRNELPPSLNFFAGGSQSLRGYDYQGIGREVNVTRPDGSERELVVGGDRLLVGSIEYQYLLRPSWRTAVFVDAGDAFDEGRFQVNYGAGVGVHYLTPVGAIKLEVANSVNADDPEWQFIINIGAEF